MTSDVAEGNGREALEGLWALQQVDSRYGGAARWLAGHGFGHDDLQLLRAKLLRT